MERFNNMKTVDLPDRVWIVERTPFWGNTITEYVVEECTYVFGKLSSIQMRNECSLYKIDIEEFLHYNRDSSICFSYEEALRKIEELDKTEKKSKELRGEE